MNMEFDTWKTKWFSMSVEKQFETAVSLIKNLPKDGKVHLQNSNYMQGPQKEPWGRRRGTTISHFTTTYIKNA